MGRFQRIFTWGMMVGGVCFAVGFFGPLVWAPDANQGPLLGIFITGPLGFLLGLGIGVVREMLGAGRAVPATVDGTASARAAAPPAAPARRFTIDEIAAMPVVRVILGLLALWLVGHGVSSLGDGGRGPAAAILIGVVAAWIAATGRIPRWTRR